MLGRGSDKRKSVLFDYCGEVGVLSKKSDARVDRISAGDRRGGKDRRDIQIAIACRGRADANGLVGEPDMHCIGVGSRMHRDGLDAHLAAGAVNAQRDLPAIGDKYFFKHWQR